MKVPIGLVSEVKKEDAEKSYQSEEPEPALRKLKSPSPNSIGKTRALCRVGEFSKKNFGAWCAQPKCNSDSGLYYWATEAPPYSGTGSHLLQADRGAVSCKCGDPQLFISQSRRDQTDNGHTPYAGARSAGRGEIVYKMGMNTNTNLFATPTLTWQC